MVKIALHVVCVCFAWLFDANGDLALIDPKEPVLEREREKKQEGRIWSSYERRLQRVPKANTQANSSSSKPITHHGTKAHEHGEHSAAATSQSHI